jgi:metal-responsive CopG/Arc/MetJ family transcriptional regulator
MTLLRTNLMLPAELLREVDELAGPRGRSRYVAEAVGQRLRRDRLRRAVEASAGVFNGTQDSMSRDEVTAWVDELRAEVTD